MTRISSHRRRFAAQLRIAVAMMPLGLALGGCASTVADLPVVGLPANTPARPAVQGEYLAVHDLPPPREEAVMTPAEVAKAEQDMIAARNRQAYGAQKPATGTRRSKALKKPESQN